MDSLQLARPRPGSPVQVFDQAPNACTKRPRLSPSDSSHTQHQPAMMEVCTETSTATSTATDSATRTEADVKQCFHQETMEINSGGNGENQDGASSTEQYDDYHTESRDSTHTKQLIPVAQDENMEERTNREYEASDKDQVNFHDREIISNDFRFQNTQYPNHGYNQITTSMSCKCRSTIVRPFKCGLCGNPYSTICQLHDHLENVHRETDMYLFDKITQTAFPRCWSSSVSTQTGTEIKPCNGSVADRIVETQTDAEKEQYEGVADRNEEAFVDTALDVLGEPLDFSSEFAEKEESDENGGEPVRSAESTYCRITAADSEVYNKHEDELVKTGVLSTKDDAEVLNADGSEFVNAYEEVMVKTEVVSSEFDSEVLNAGDATVVYESADVLVKAEVISPDDDLTFQNYINSNILSPEKQKKNEHCTFQSGDGSSESSVIVLDDLHTNPSLSPTTDDRECLFKCFYCTLKFASFNLYIRHVKEEHGKQTFCKICDRQYASRKSYLRHLKYHKNLESCKCDTCGELFTSSYNLNLHIRDKHYGAKTVMCQKCGKRFVWGSLLHRHRKKCLDNGQHNAVKRLDITFPCTFENCGKTFRTRACLNNHLAAHSREASFKCEICLKGLSCRSQFEKHMLRHSDDKPCTCNVCGKAYKHEATLKKHMVEHSGEIVRYVCDVCGKEYKQRSTLMDHVMLVHENKGPREYACTFEHCGKIYRQKHSLRAHLTTHTGELRHKCDICGKRFTESSVLKTHKLQKHSKERPWKCDQCQWAFQTKGGLAKHKKTHTVTQDEMLPCDVCGKAFSNKWNLEAHVRQHTGEKPFVCEICGSAFTHKVSLKNHMKVHKASDTQSTPN